MPTGDPPTTNVFTPLLPLVPQQGWQCPTCHRCYSPMTAMCFYCPAQPVFTNEGSTQGKPADEVKP